MSIEADFNPSETPPPPNQLDDTIIKLDHEEEESCKKISFTDFSKLRGGEKSYEDAVREAAKFNASLDRDRRRRLPFLESHTRVTQVPNVSLNLLAYQRIGDHPANRSRGKVFVYPTRKWFKSKRILTDKSLTMPYTTHQSYQMHKSLSNPDDMLNLQQQQSAESNSFVNPTQHSNAMNRSFSLGTNPSSIQLAQSLALSQNSNSLSASLRANLITQSPQQLQQQPAKDEHRDWQYKEDVLDNLEDVDSDGSDYEDRKKRKKKGKKVKIESGQGVLEDKPYVCEKCNARYKTKPGLSYHLQKVHPVASTGATVSISNHGSNSLSAMHHFKSGSTVAGVGGDLVNEENTRLSTTFESTSYDEINSLSNHL